LSNRKTSLFEVTEEFVRDYNRALPNERTKLNELIYRMLQRLKVKRKTRKEIFINIYIYSEKSITMSNTYKSTYSITNGLVDLFCLKEFSREVYFRISRAELCLLSQCKSSYQEGKNKEKRRYFDNE
jgi:hypothetical protein